MEPLTLTELGARIAQRWRTVLLGALAAAVLAGATQLAMPARFEAVAVVHVDSVDPDLVDMAAEEAIVTSRRVTSEALDTLGERGLKIGQLEQAASASAVDESRLLHITYVAARPRLATRGADAVAHAYLATRAVDAMRTPGPAAVTGVVVDPARRPDDATGAGTAATTLGGMILGLIIATPIAARPTRRRAARAS